MANMPICESTERKHKRQSTVGAVYEGVNELGEREFPSLAKEGCREAAGWFDQEMNYLTNTTLALRATPPLLRRGISLCAEHVRQFGGESPLPNLMEVKG